MLKFGPNYNIFSLKILASTAAPKCCGVMKVLDSWSQTYF